MDTTDGNLQPDYKIYRFNSKPKSLDVMLKSSKELSEPFIFVRVDFYEYKDVPIL